jgi:hypothetical protein
MHTTTLLDLSPIRAMAKSGKLTTSGRLTATSVTSFSTNSGEGILQDNYALLATLQEREIHAPPSPRPARAGARSATKTQLQAERKAAKDARANAVEDKKLSPQLVRPRPSQKTGVPYLLHQGQGGQGSCQGTQTPHQTGRGHQSWHLPYSFRARHGSPRVHFLSLSQKEQRDCRCPLLSPYSGCWPSAVSAAKDDNRK